jgi:hypothetical protein
MSGYHDKQRKERAGIMTKGKYPESGGVGVRVVLAVITLAVIGVFIAVMFQHSGQRQEANHRKAVGISEYGLQAALQKLQESPLWAGGFARTPCDGGWYTVSLHRFVRNDSFFLSITAEGTMGAVSEVKEYLLTRVPGSRDSLWTPQNIH